MIKNIVLFHNDFRIEDNPALFEASKKGEVIPLFVWDPEKEDPWQLGGASKWWLHYSLKNLKSKLISLNSDLFIRSGKTIDILEEIIKETKATGIFWNRLYDPSMIKLQTSIHTYFQKKGILTIAMPGNLLYEPWLIKNKQFKPFQVFTPFWKTCLKQYEPLLPLPIPKKISTFKQIPHSDSIESLHLLPKIHWDTGLIEMWKPGEDQAKIHLENFIKNNIYSYQENRDRPDLMGTSLLSPYLHFGEISPRTIWHALKDLNTQQTECYSRQLGWREFAHHLLYHFPETESKPLRKEFEYFPWKYDLNSLKKWQKGMTGYPIIDAGMRQLWKTGWMHNRVRMITGSFLVKDLMIPWQEGAKWFWDTLVDADLANNTLGWQWVSGCGADAAPYFRIFNPITQSKKFDPNGDYIRQWIPELKTFPTKWIHDPWESPINIQKEANVLIGYDYPYPIVDHSVQRNIALEAFKNFKN